MNGPVTNTEQPGISHLGVYQNCFNKFKDGYDTQNNGQNYFVGSNQVNFDSYSSEGYNDYINTPDAWNRSEGTGSWSTSFNGYMEERLDDAIGVLQKHAESCSYSPQIDCDVPSLSFPNVSQSNTLSVTSLSVQPHVLNNNKKSASGYAHFFRERQARIKEENKTEKTAYKRKAENAKNDQCKDITHAMAVAGIK
uniref:Uncharacterized protein n=1 Tax=Tetranychus urticae TaxID=32264 RepID=T1L1A2_TETUR